MKNSQHDNEDTARLCLNTACDNCGREIESDACPYCGFEYRAEEDEEGIYYY